MSEGESEMATHSLARGQSYRLCSRHTVVQAIVVQSAQLWKLFIFSFFCSFFHYYSHKDVPRTKAHTGEESVDLNAPHGVALPHSIAWSYAIQYNRKWIPIGWLSKELSATLIDAHSNTRKKSSSTSSAQHEVVIIKVNKKRSNILINAKAGPSQKPYCPIGAAIV